MDDSVNSTFTYKIEEKFGKLSRTTGKKPTLLGMDIHLIGGNKVALNMPSNIAEALEDFDETQKDNVVNPVTSKRFIINDEAKELDNERKLRKHLITTNIFWIMKWSRPDLDTLVYLLCTTAQWSEKEFGET